MVLEDLRSKALYQNSLDVWIGVCKEKDIKWSEPEYYKKFIEYLQSSNLSMKKFSLCVSEADSSIKENNEKIKFAESLSASNDSNCDTYTLKLNDFAIKVIRNFDLNKLTS